MDLYKDIIAEVLSKKKVRIRFENLEIRNPNEIVEMVCYKTIQRIRKVLSNDELNDFECVERIVKLIEEIDSDGGLRHDFL